MALKHGSAMRISGLFIVLMATLLALALSTGHDGKRFAGRLYRLIGMGRVSGLDSAGFGTASMAETASGPVNPASMPVAPTVIGINMGIPNYYSTERTFNDPIQTTGQLFYYEGATSHAVKFTNQTATDLNGRPINIAAGTRFELAIQNHNGEALSGKYDCRVAPGWTVKSAGSKVLVSQNGIHFTILAPRDQGNDHRFGLELTANVDHAALSELSCVNIASSGLFNPAFLDDVRPFRIVRFMDWMRTNGAPMRIWEERPTPQTLSQAGDKGVSLEDMVALCTQLTCDPWFTLPWDADADYYRNFATYVRDHLPKDRKVYVELSNEVWNSAFLQSRLATQLGHQKYPDLTDDTQANAFYYADRVRALMKIWDDVFAGQQQRLVRVYASQAAWAGRAQIGLSHDDTWRSVDALAIAPYLFQFLQTLPGTGKDRIDAAFAKGPALVDQAMRWSLDNKAIAQHFGLRLVGYEGGQHYFAYTPDASADLIAMQHDPRMYDLYTSYLDRWQREIGGPLVLYQSTGNGSWGHKDYTGQPLSEAPKMRAVLDFINRNK